MLDVVQADSCHTRGRVLCSSLKRRAAPWIAMSKQNRIHRSPVMQDYNSSMSNLMDGASLINLTDGASLINLTDGASLINLTDGASLINLTDGAIRMYNMSQDHPVLRPPDDILLLQGVVRWLQLYYVPAISMTGLLTNIMCVLVISRYTKPSPSHVYTMALVLAESLQLLALLHEWCNEMGADLFQMPGWCHMFTFLYKGSQFLCQWYLVCWVLNCCLDATSRLDTISNSTGSSRGPSTSPAASTLWSPTCYARITTIALAVLAIIVFINLSLTADVMFIELRQVHACITLDIYATILFYLDHVDVLLNVLMPCVLVILFSGKIIQQKLCTRGSQLDSKDKTWLYCIVHSMIWLPLQLIRIIDTITVLASHTTHNTLRSYLWQQIVIYINYTNMVLHVAFLFACHQEFRLFVIKRLSDICSASFVRCRHNKEQQMIENDTGSRRGTSIEVVTPSDEEMGDDAC